jgi:guanine deaminase
MTRTLLSPHLGGQQHAIQADLLDFTASPQWGDTSLHGVRWRPQHWLLVGADGRIAGVQQADPGPQWQRHRHTGRLLMPGFIDTHVHSPQLGVMARHGTQLLDWLNTYTFPAEATWADPAVASAGTARFLDALLAHGTTTAMVFATVHAASATALFEQATARNMRVIGGKVLMDRNAPASVCDTVASSERDSIDLIERWHGQGRCSYAVTVRFAPTSSPAQLAMAGELCRGDTSLYMQTHVAENQAELQWVAQLYPHARSYLDVYAQAQLLHPRAMLAHGIWLGDEDRAVLAGAGASLAFCPSSNLFLGSGLFNWPEAANEQVAVTVASDVGGGTSLSMQRTLADAYKVQALAGHRLSAWTALHAATRGAAQALHLGYEIGSLEVGHMADLCVWDWAVGAVDSHRQTLATSLHDRLFAWMLLSDERHLVSTWVAGQELYTRAAAAATLSP